jgi:hypothetical protein
MLPWRSRGLPGSARRAPAPGAWPRPGLGPTPHSGRCSPDVARPPLPVAPGVLARRACARLACLVPPRAPVRPGARPGVPMARGLELGQRAAPARPGATRGGLAQAQLVVAQCPQRDIVVRRLPSVAPPCARRLGAVRRALGVTRSALPRS